MKFIASHMLVGLVTTVSFHPEAACGASPPVQSKDAMPQIVVTVAEKPAQILQGFGASLQTEIGPMPGDNLKDLSKRVVRDLQMDFVRIWAPSGEKETVDSMLQTFTRRYVESGRLELADQNGVKIHLLAPARGETAPLEPVTEYARKLAEFILQLKVQHKVRINVTGVANEPAGFSPQQMTECVRTLRAELDSRSLREVGIVAPEFASNDGKAAELIEALRNDPAALKALKGVATHSYNMAANSKIEGLAVSMKKEFWITEAGNTGHEDSGDTQRAASLAARFLNDLNHGVTHWCQFIGFGDSPDVTKDRDNATKLMAFDRKTGVIFESLQYSYLRMARVAFPTGCQIFPVSAQPGGDLLNSYGQKPQINVAAGKLADGRWAVAVVNLTGLESTPIATYHPAADLKVSIKLPPSEASRTRTFRSWRSAASKQIVSEPAQSVLRGVISAEIHPQELLIFREDPRGTR